jgi:hypothetical protein
MFLDVQLDIPDDGKAEAFVNARTGLKRENLQRLSSLLAGYAGGAQTFDTGVFVVSNPAAGTLTFTGAPTATQTCSINGVTFTARASGAAGNEFNIGGSPTVTATNLAAAINASSSAKLTNSVIATSNAGVVTITARIPGFAGLGYVVSAGNLANASAVDFALAAESSRVTF